MCFEHTIRLDIDDARVKRTRDAISSCKYSLSLSLSYGSSTYLNFSLSSFVGYCVESIRDDDNDDRGKGEEDHR